MPTFRHKIDFELLQTGTRAYPTLKCQSPHSNCNFIQHVETFGIEDTLESMYWPPTYPDMPINFPITLEEEREWDGPGEYTCYYHLIDPRNSE